MEFGESYAETVVREFKEDAGLVVVPVKLLKLSDSLTYSYPNGDAVQPINCFYLVRYVSGQLLTAKTNETTALRYVDMAQPPTFFNAQHAEMFAVLKTYLKN